MSKVQDSFSLTVEATNGSCPVGESVGKQNMAEGKIPVFSCEGACIRGEIARLAANMVAKETPYRRGCHGELLTVPQSAMARWARSATQAIVIDGCFLRCHARVMRGLFKPGRLVEIDALSHYKRYTDVFDIDSVPEEERKAVARSVANWVLETTRPA
jgi:uncharacterized metal-binding protein